MSEEILIEGLKRKDPRIQQHLYKRWYRYLFAVAFSVVKNQMDAEDVLQESFVKIFDKIEMFTPGNSLKAWMATTVKRTAITHYNTNKKYQQYEMLDGFEPMQIKATYFIDALVARDAFESAMKILHHKSSNQYMYARLYLVEGMSGREISEDINVPEGTCKSQISRACANLRMYLEDFENIRVFNN